MLVIKLYYHKQKTLKINYLKIKFLTNDYVILTTTFDKNFE